MQEERCVSACTSISLRRHRRMTGEPPQHPSTERGRKEVGVGTPDPRTRASTYLPPTDCTIINIGSGRQGHTWGREGRVLGSYYGITGNSDKVPQIETQSR